MLVLSRAPGEYITISHNGKVVGRIKLVEIRRMTQARLGFEFDRAYTIDREEIHVKRTQEVDQPTCKPIP